ncbi:MAG TPA: hypothetical protein VF453_08125 [Burkholderiaceae bacterium]
MTDALARAEMSFVDNLRRIAVIAQVDDSSGVPTLLPSVDALLRWVAEYNAAFVQANERWCAGRLHSFHHRQVTLAGRHLFLAPDDILRIGRYLQKIGVSLAVSVPIQEMSRYPLVLPTLRSELPGLYVQIECAEASAGVDADVDAATTAAAAAEPQPEAKRGLSSESRRALEAHVDSGGSVNLLSSIAELRHAGLAQHEGLNRAGFSVARPAPRGTRPMHRIHRVSPCSDYLGWHVDAAGDIFPCIGMVGHAPARLGNIAGRFVDALHALAGTRDAMVGLAERGPDFLAPPASVPFDLCALHRDAVTDLESI